MASPVSLSYSRTSMPYSASAEVASSKFGFHPSLAWTEDLRLMKPPTVLTRLTTSLRRSPPPVPMSRHGIDLAIALAQVRSKSQGGSSATSLEPSAAKSHPVITAVSWIQAQRAYRSSVDSATLPILPTSCQPFGRPSGHCGVACEKSPIVERNSTMKSTATAHPPPQPKTNLSGAGTETILRLRRGSRRRG